MKKKNNIKKTKENYYTIIYYSSGICVKMATQDTDISEPTLNENTLTNQDIKTNKFKTNAMERLAKLQSGGISYRRVVHKLDIVLSKYILDMNEKHKQLGNRNLELMSIAVKSIFLNVTISSQYDVIEYVHNVMDWYFKCLAFKYNLIKKQPNLPDFTIPEILDLAKHCPNTN